MLPTLKWTYTDPDKVEKGLLTDFEPTFGSAGAIGLDLKAAQTIKIEHGVVDAVPTHIAVEIPEGYYGRIAPRSGLAKNYGVDVLAGVIDSDYRGEIFVLLTSHEKAVRIERGQKIAQLILERADRPILQYVDALGETGRGSGGFGSTG